MFTEDVQERGLLLGGEALQPISTATTVRVRNGERLVTDGPFAETTEQLGGFYLLNCKNLDEAIDLAAKIPGRAARLDRDPPDHGVRLIQRRGDATDARRTITTSLWRLERSPIPPPTPNK